MAAIVLVAGAIGGANYVLVWRPVSAALDEDSRNDGFTLRAHLAKWVLPNSLVLDLTRADAVSPMDLTRGLLQAAAALHNANRPFKTVILARSGRPVFVMSGPEFRDVGEAYELGENPVYLVRTLPEKLRMPDGDEAFGTWEGGLLGVLSKQLEDVNEFARQWVAGTRE